MQESSNKDMDMFKMFEKAKDMAELMNLGSSDNNDNTSDFDMDKMMRAIEIIKTLQSTMNGQPSYDRHNTTNPETPNKTAQIQPLSHARNDDNYNDDFFFDDYERQNYKAYYGEDYTDTEEYPKDHDIAPKRNPPDLYDDIPQTPALQTIKAALPYIDAKHRKGLGIAIKMIEIQQLLEGYSETIATMTQDYTGDWRRGMLTSIRPYMDEDKRHIIDMCLKFIDIKELLEDMSLTEYPHNTRPHQ